MNDNERHPPPDEDDPIISTTDWMVFILAVTVLLFGVLIAFLLW